MLLSLNDDSPHCRISGSRVVLGDHSNTTLSVYLFGWAATNSAVVK